MILEEYDDVKTSTFDPCEVENVINDFPKVGVTCFSKKLIDSFLEKYNHEQIVELSNANGKIPVYKIKFEGKEIALFLSRVGAPACTISYEEILAMGLEKLVMCGTCGVLNKEIDDLSIIIPTSAVRDEGTSYHYLPSSNEIIVNEKNKDMFEKIAKMHNYSFVEGKVWTTDAPYRETINKVLKRKKQGCICVDMECSAMFAVAKFRNKELFQFFYAADNLDAAKWDARSLDNDAKLSDKEKILLLALKFSIIF